MGDTSFLAWPFFEPHHRELAQALEHWSARTAATIAQQCEPHDADATTVAWVRALGQGGWLLHSGIDPDQAGQGLDVRALCLIRERLAQHHGLADFAFAMQGLGTGALSLFGDSTQRQALRQTRTGQCISAFALTEPQSGSDVAASTMSAERDGEDYVLNGEKTWISNAGIANAYTVFARTGEAPGAKGLSAFWVPADTPGLSVIERLHTIAPHPLGRLRFTNCRVSVGQRIGAAGAGFGIAMAVLDVFRSTVAAAALGFARRALDQALMRVQSRRIAGVALAELQMVQGHIADMAVEIDAAALLIYRAAWTKDTQGGRVTREAAMAKLYATEAAQRVIDTAVQLHGGDGVRSGEVVEHLYRDIRALRIYEGASDVQRVIIARQTLAAAPLSFPR